MKANVRVLVLFPTVAIALLQPAWGGDVSVSLDSSNGSSAFLVENSSTAQCIKVQSDGKVSIGNIDPQAPLHVLSQGNWNLNTTGGDFKVGTAAYGLKVGVATGGGGAGDVRMRAQGGSDRLILGGGSNDVLMIRETGVGINKFSPEELFDVQGNVKVSGSGNGFIFPDGSKQTTAASSGSGLTLPYNGTLSSGGKVFKVSNSGSGEAIEGLHSASGNHGRLGTSGYGVYGYAGVGDIGVYGWAPSAKGGNGVMGISAFGTGVSGQTVNGIGVYAVASGDTGVGLYAKGNEFGFAAFFDGWIRGPVKIEGALEVRGGADLSEAFVVRTATPHLEPEPGMLVSIDREHPGGLLVSREAYDRCLAGIITFQYGSAHGTLGIKAHGHQQDG